MDEGMGIVEFIKIASFLIGLGGLVLGVDAIFGAKIISLIDTILSKSIDLDKMIIGKRTHRLLLGIVFLAVSIAAIFLAKL
jgi:hypothetical protein